MKNITKLIFMAGSGFLLSGCIASQSDMSTLKLQLQALNSTIVQMQANQAELAGKMDELNQNLLVSGENLAQMDGQLSKFSAKLDDLAASVSRSAHQTTTKTVLPSELFAEAKNHLDKEAFEPAATGFKLYVTQYPNAENTDQAYMYMGDAYLAAGKTKSAAVAYATLLQKFPQSKLIPAARLKYARSIVPLGKTDEAKRYLSSIIKEFSSSEEAKLAKSDLAKLK
ncbi:MAG: tetratricopeptide repeat protein [Elusimicrobiaceae bacterium]|nr:tetratricopeptide repeat protein [Elusimicrobiaceae bacterium]